MMSHNTLLIASLFTLLACAGESNEPWMAPPQADGKADAIATLTGDAIPSDFVDDDATYLHDRSIAALVQVGALTGPRYEVASRADGIIDALPADGRLDVEELVRLEESPYFDLLFPEEQDALPTMWPLLEVPDSAPVRVEFADIQALEIEDRTIEPSGLELPDWLTIDQFSAAVRDALRRMELAFDDDGDDNTVALADIDDALDNPGAFTPAEIQAIRDAKDEFLARGVSGLSAITAVPTPGEVEREATVGAITFDHHATTIIDERRRETDWNDSHSKSYRVGIDIIRDELTWPRLDEDQQLLVIENLQERDQVLGTDVRTVPAGVYLVELWHEGERHDVVWAELPRLGESSARLEIDERVAHALETFDGSPLQRNIREAGWRRSDWYEQSWAYYTWDIGPEEPTADVNAASVNRLRLPRTSFAPGRYATEDDDGNEILLDIFPQGALRATYRGHTSWMYLSSNGSSGWSRRHSAQTGDRNVHYLASQNRLTAWRNIGGATHYYANIQLEESDREQ